MLFLLPLLGAAFGVVAGALITRAAGEEDKQAAKYHREVANELMAKYSNLQKKYNQLEEKSKSQVDYLTRQHALDESEKDLFRLAVRLQNSLYPLMWSIDNKPTRDTLDNFEESVKAINEILIKLNEEPIEIPERYFSRNLGRIKRREKLADKKSQQEDTINSTVQ